MNYTKTVICLPTNKGFMCFTIPVPWGESRATLQGAGLVGKASIDSGKRHRQWNNKSLWALFWDRWRANSSISLLRVRGAKENVVSRMLHTGFIDDYYEHIPLIKSGEDNQWIQFKRMLIKGPVPSPNTTSQNSFRLTVRKRRMVSSL